MKAVLAGIDAWLRTNAPAAFVGLRPPASRDYLTELELSLGLPVPDDPREWLSAHDGQPPDSLIGMLVGWIFLGADRIAATHRTFSDLLSGGDFKGQDAFNRDGQVKAGWWNPGWVPFLEGPGGDYLVIDTDPGELGTAGQVVTFWHDYGARKAKAVSLRSLLAEFLADLEAGRYEVKTKGGLRRA
jgi:cell wall assembly regulator SMI1